MKPKSNQHNDTTIPQDGNDPMIAASPPASGLKFSKPETNNPPSNGIDTTTELSIDPDQFGRILQRRLELRFYEGLPFWCFGGERKNHAVIRQDGRPALSVDDAWLCSFDCEDPFIAEMIRILITEVYRGWHTQQSLEEALAQCEQLSPTKGWVRVSALHQFLGENCSCFWWFVDIVIRSMESEKVSYRFREPAYTPTETIGDTHKFCSKLAFRVALSSRGLRGNILRENFFSLHRALNAKFFPTYEEPSANCL